MSRSFFGNERHEKRRRALSFSDVDRIADACLRIVNLNLSKVDEIGFVDLTPGSGHGQGGYSDVGWIEVYGKPVPCSVAT